MNDFICLLSSMEDIHHFFTICKYTILIIVFYFSEIIALPFILGINSLFSSIKELLNYNSISFEKFFCQIDTSNYLFHTDFFLYQ